MRKQILGNTGIEVSRLCYGSLTLGPLQANLPVDRAGQLIAYAYDRGVNFIDTADLYDNYAHIKNALDLIGKHNMVIASKSYAYDEKGARQTVERALKELGREYIDIWLMHEQESDHTIRGHYEALETYHQLKKEGKIRAVGISTHYVDAVSAALNYPEIEVIHPIFNIAGIGIQGGTRDEMHAAITKAYDSGRGIYGMKVLGGGNLLSDRDAAFDFALSQTCFHSYALGMQHEDEIDFNVKRISGEDIEPELYERLKSKKKRISIDPWCTRCKACISACQHGALSFDALSDKMVVDRGKCVLCGYCSKKCADFCIKII
ncbi:MULTISPECIES: aldo/keto reductase [unclassified Fusibacter]|uniref:aldo/keto reductase n=1 Tax=unclassified Fusibacter TaxID=2624464 RepID=UPI0010100D83|nr:MULTISPECIES: aldo/keto reductase [unclassified Fusibacter]MCK8058917.1 aldo/keto reductase [Fusibacter sp. A2]NPE21992.1 aldo/keto reductase [Fusibacter sp. A1]RXV61558.1 aldo/keto reductase [Fusibacter sp. A1]